MLDPDIKRFYRPVTYFNTFESFKTNREGFKEGLRGLNLPPKEETRGSWATLLTRQTVQINKSF